MTRNQQFRSLAQCGGMQQPVTVRTVTTLLAVDLMRLAMVPRAAAYVVYDVRRSALIGGRAGWGGGQPGGIGRWSNRASSRPTSATRW